MGEPKNLLLVTNSITEEEISKIKDAMHHALTQQGLTINLYLVHVIPTLPTCYFNIPSMVMLAERYYEEAKTSLTHIGTMLNVPTSSQWLITGRIRNEVLRLAAKLHIDFILASSTSIHDLRKAFVFKKPQQVSSIQSINSIGVALTSDAVSK